MPNNDQLIQYPRYLKISGPGEAASGKLVKMTGVLDGGASAVRFEIAGNDGAAQVTVSPWPQSAVLPACSTDCSAEYLLNTLPDGPEWRLVIRRAGKVVLFVASHGRMRRVLLGEPVLLGPGPVSTAEFSGRKAVSLTVNDKHVRAGGTIDAGGCSLFVAQASVAKPARQGIADEAAKFTADWIISCR